MTVCFKIYFTWDHFIKHKIEIADAIIVFISFILDLVFLNDDAVGGLVGKFRVVQTKAILFPKSMSERFGSDIERL